MILYSLNNINILKYIFRILSVVLAPVTKAMGVSWEIRGREHLEQERSCIVVMNHQSIFDCVGLYQLWPFLKKSTIISRRIIFYIWPSGLMGWFGKVIFINRMNSNLARKVLNDATNYIKEKKVIVICKQINHFHKYRILILSLNVFCIDEINNISRRN